MKDTPVSSRFIFPELGDLILRKCLEYFRDTQNASNLFRLRSQMYWKASMCNNSTKANSHLIYMLNRDLIVLLKTFYHSGSPYPESLNACCAWRFFSGTIVMKPNPIVELHIFRHSYDKQIHVFPATKIWSLSSSSYAFFFVWNCLLQSSEKKLLILVVESDKREKNWIEREKGASYSTTYKKYIVIRQGGLNTLCLCPRWQSAIGFFFRHRILLLEIKS